ncbi:MAG: hypothetical protein KDA57_03795 [Planctomycetales bacterium]|nr:hypothetical protein [Planctomycetales bacterium]
MRWHKSLAAVLLFSILFSAQQASADILFTTGAMVEIASPASFLEGDLESSSVISILDEGVKTLPGDIFVNAVGVGTHFGSAGTPVPVLAGTEVQTYLVHFDPLGAGFATLSGSVFFVPGEIILGIQTHTPWLDFSDAAVGDPLSTYPTGLLEFRALETLPGTDTTTIAPGLGSASFSLFAELGIDQARIVTMPVPEPSTLTLLLGSAALLPICRRALS